MVNGFSYSAACGIILDQVLNPCPLHWQVDSQPLLHQGSPGVIIKKKKPEFKMTKPDYKIKDDVVVKNNDFLNQKDLNGSFKNSYVLIFCNPLCKPK